MRSQFSIPAKGREVQKFNQGLPGNRGNYCRGSFLFFFGEEKRKTLIEELQKRIKTVQEEYETAGKIKI